jgi:ABC-type sugar transport system permease subunit
MRSQHKTKHRMRLTTLRNLHGYVFIFPFLCGLLFLFLPSVAESLRYSFFDVKLSFSNVNMTFVGWNNFIDSFQSDTEYRVVLMDTVKGMLIDTLIILFFSFFISNLLNQKFHGRAMARTLFFLPVILSTGIIASADASTSAMALGVVGEAGSAIGSAFKGNGLSSFFDLETLLLSMDIPDAFSGTITYAIDNTYKVVNHSGVQILIFLSALQSISPAIFEASRMEGATKWEEFWKITFPMITPMILVNIVYTIVDSFVNPSYGMLDYVQNQAFSLNKMGYASALSWIYFVIVFAMLGIIYGLLSKRITYLD